MVRILTEHEWLCRECENRPKADLSGIDWDVPWGKLIAGLTGEQHTITIVRQHGPETS